MSECDKRDEDKSNFVDTFDKFIHFEGGDQDQEIIKTFNQSDLDTLGS